MRLCYIKFDMPKRPQLLSPTEYIHDAASQINQAERRVVYLSMVAIDVEPASELFDAMIAAAQRGVSVDFVADIFSYTEAAETSFPIQYFSHKTRRATNIRNRLIKSGVKFRWLGVGRSFLFSGRTHSKWCVVDDTVYSFGGVNLDNGITSRFDYMFKIEDQTIADALVNEHERIKKSDDKNAAYRNHKLDTNLGTILFDGGLFGRSIIYRRAVELSEQASKVTLVSQYCPSGKLSRILHKKDEKVKLYFNQPKNATFLNSLLITWNILTTGNKTRYKKSNYLHAKFMLFEMPDGSKKAITGSYNFSFSSVFFGTREIALETSNQQIISELEDFLAKKVK